MKIGDKVEVLDEAISGAVTAIEGAFVSILSKDGFEMEFLQHELIVIDGSVSKKDLGKMDLSQILAEKQVKKPGKTQSVKPKERNVPPMEVDLHIHQLVPNMKNIEPYEILNIQLETAKRQLEFAISKKIQKVVFIHGVGEGVLRSELEFLINRFEDVKFYDADYQKYGRGAMEVYIFQSNFLNQK